MRGHVTRRGKTCSYVIDVGADPSTGKRRQRTKGGFATKAAAETAVRAAIAEFAQPGGLASGEQRLGEYLEGWLKSVKADLRATTFASYSNAVKRLNAEIGAVKLRDLTPAIIEACYTRLGSGEGQSKRALAPKTVRNTHIVLRKALSDAERLELVSRNAASKARPPSVVRTPVETWTEDELADFLEAVEHDEYYALWALLATTGLRRGEALGLRWADVDLKRATLSVAQTITTINYRVVIAPPKTDRSRRRNKLDPETVAVLVAHRERQDAERRAAGLRPTARDDLVFANVLGEPPHPDRITARFKVLVSEAGLRPLKGPHALRHTWASLALAEGVHPKVVSDRLGHSTIAITIDTYSHVMPSLDEEAAGTVANLIYRKKHAARSESRAVEPGEEADGEPSRDAPKEPPT